MTSNIWTELRKPFPAEEVGKLPRVTCPDCSDKRKNCTEHKKAKCNVCQAWVSTKHIHIDYVGHADVTSRLLAVDPEWNWAPKSEDEHGMPVFDTDDQGQPVGLWIKLTAGGVTRLGYGSVPSGQPDAVKVLIGDALRNAAMRFGVALDLWAKGDRADPTAENATGSGGQARRGRQSTGDVFEQAATTPPSSQESRGQVARPTVQAAPGPDAGIDEEAQAFADDAHTCRSVMELKTRIHATAEQRDKLTAYIADPGTGIRGQLGPYLNYRRKALEAVDAALAEFHVAAEAAHMLISDIEEHVKRTTGADFEKATAAQLRQATAALNGKAALDGHPRGSAGGHSRVRLAAVRAD